MVEDEVTGILCSPKNSGELAKKILLLANDRELRVKMGRYLRVIAAECYHPYSVSQKIDGVYHNVVGH